MRQSRRLARLLLVLTLLSACGDLSGNPTLPPASTPTLTPPPTMEVLLRTPDDVLDFIAARPDDMALVAYSVAADGSIDPAGPTLQHQADTPMPLASTVKVLALAAYAWSVDQGLLSPDQAISLDQWERWYLPNTDGKAHYSALSEIGIPTDNLGFAVEPQQSVTLSQVVRAMIRFSDNAALDLLLELLGPDALATTMRLGNVQGQDAPMPLLGLFLLIENDGAPLDQARLQELKALAPAELQQAAAAASAAYIAPTMSREERIARATALPLPDYDLQMAYFQALGPQGTAAGYAQIMAGVVSNTFISPAVSARMREFLEWPLEIEGNTEQFTQFGVKGGALPGILTEAMYVVPKIGAWAGQKRVVVLFQRNLPDNAWTTFMTGFAHQALEVDIAANPEFAALAQKRIK